MTNFTERWQMGLYLKILLANVHGLETADNKEGTILHYQVPTEWENGEVTRARHYEAKLVGATLDECYRAAQSHSEEEIPYSVKQSLNHVLGKPREPMAKSPPREPSPTPTKKTSSPPRSKEGVITLGSLCDEAKVEASVVRAKLRAKKIEKPAYGWTFEPDDPRIDQVREVIREIKGK